jgi:hypothetical protein
MWRKGRRVVVESLVWRVVWNAVKRMLERVVWIVMERWWK